MEQFYLALDTQGLPLGRNLIWGLELGSRAGGDRREGPIGLGSNEPTSIQNSLLTRSPYMKTALVRGLVLFVICPPTPYYSAEILLLHCWPSASPCSFVRVEC